MIGALIFSVVAALCGQVQDLNPGGAMLDAIEWTVPSKDFRAAQHMEGSDGNYMSTYVTTDKIWNLKTPGGDVWDVSYYDSEGIWSWTTEYKWGDPTTYTRFLIDAETRLNPAAAGSYFGASGGPENKPAAGHEGHGK